MVHGPGVGQLVLQRPVVALERLSRQAAWICPVTPARTDTDRAGPVAHTGDRQHGQTARVRHEPHPARHCGRRRTNFPKVRDWAKLQGH